MVMRATLHDHAPNPYYGQWRAQNAGKHAAKPGAIARNEPVASPGVAPFDGAQRDFPGNRSPASWKLISRPKRKNLRARPSALPACGRESTRRVDASNDIRF